MSILFLQVLAFSIRKSDMDLRKTLYSNIVLSGGSTLYRGKCIIGASLSEPHINSTSIHAMYGGTYVMCAKYMYRL